MIWVVSMAILVLGALVVLYVISPGERERRDVLDRIAIGTPADSVQALLGEPHECPVASLQRLGTMLPTGWPTAAVRPAMERLTTETSAIWIYPVDEGDAGNCAGADDQTEIGFDADQRVLWYVAVTGKTALVLPPDYEPGFFAQ